MIERAKQFLASRRGAYRAVFDPQGVYTSRVLRDLAKFCRANESTAHPDTHAAARLDGRREVWLRIQQHLQLTDEQLWQLYNPLER
jgi:hypothetical protein